MQRFRLADPLMVVANWDDSDNIAYGVAEVAARKALASVVVWLREFASLYPDRPEHAIACGRGHGLEMAAKELEAMLGPAPVLAEEVASEVCESDD